MSDTDYQVNVPIEVPNDAYADDSFDEDSDQDAVDGDSNDNEEKVVNGKLSSKVESDDEVEYPGLNEKEMNKDNSHNNVEANIDNTSKKKKANGLDLTPPNVLLQDARNRIKILKLSSNNVNNKEAIHELVRAVALARIVYGDGHWQLAQSYTDLAQGYLELMNYIPQAVGHAETAKQIMSTSVHTAKDELEKAKILEVRMHVYFILGRALAAQKKFVESEKCFLTSESVYKVWAKSSLVSLYDIDREVKIIVALAKISLMQEKFANASARYEKALDLLETSRGKNCKELIPIYQGLGTLELAKGSLGNPEQAIRMFVTAHTINTGLCKTGAIPIAETGMALANAYSTIGGSAAEASAESYLNECLIICLSHYGPNHESTINVKDEVVKLLLRTDRYEEGIRELKSAIKAKEEMYGEFSEEVADSYKLLANVHLAKGNTDAAMKSFKICVNIETMLHGTNHRHVKDVQACIDMLMANPKVAAKQPKSKQEELNERPRFSPIVKGN